MKISDHISRFLVSFMCASALTIGNLFCLITAFDIPVDTDMLILLCISASLLFSVAFIFKRAWIGMSLVVCLVMGLVVYNWSSVIYGFVLTARTMMEQYIDAYDELSGLVLVADVPYGTLTTSFMALLGAVLVLITVATVSRRYSIVPLATVSILLLALCMLIPWSMPDVWAFCLLLGTYALMIMTQSRRRHSKNGQYPLTLIMALPVAIFMLIIVNAVQPATYVRSDQMMDLRADFRAAMEKYAIFERDEVTGEVEFVSPIVEETLGIVSWNDNVSETDLSRIGPQGQTGVPVMSVYSEKAGEYYLKGNSLAVYEDNRWLALDEAEYGDVPITEGLWQTDAAAWEEIQIRTDRRSSILYLPYIPTSLPENSEIYYDSYVSNTGNVVDYAVALAENAPSAEISSEYEAFVHEIYTQVPDETRAALSELTEQLTQKAWVEYDQTAAGVVAEYVQESAVYDLNTPQMPEGEDFVTWFLEESDTGYCVHYASAATMLLRCMGIPARYVTGYLVHTEADQWTTVTQDNAHAWVEYYTDGYGWRKIEPTPASSANDMETEQSPSEAEDSPEEEPMVDPGVIPGVTEAPQAEGEPISLTFVWVILSIAVVMVLWCPVMRRIRMVVLFKGTYNERAIKYYRRIVFLSRLAHKPVLETVEELALKARFSQHRLSKDELVVLENAYSELCTSLRAKQNPAAFVLYHFILALPKP